ncbi:hypothetical protein ABZP36_001886 [Zizania latifolia]
MSSAPSPTCSSVHAEPLLVLLHLGAASRSAAVAAPPDLLARDPVSGARYAASYGDPEACTAAAAAAAAQPPNHHGRASEKRKKRDSLARRRRRRLRVEKRRESPRRDVSGAPVFDAATPAPRATRRRKRFRGFAEPPNGASATAGRAGAGSENSRLIARKKSG